MTFPPLFRIVFDELDIIDHANDLAHARELLLHHIFDGTYPGPFIIEVSTDPFHGDWREVTGYDDTKRHHVGIGRYHFTAGGHRRFAVIEYSGDEWQVAIRERWTKSSPRSLGSYATLDEAETAALQAIVLQAAA